MAENAEQTQTQSPETTETQAETLNPQSEVSNDEGDFVDVDFSELAATSESDVEATPPVTESSKQLPEEQASAPETPATEEAKPEDKKDEGETQEASTDDKAEEGEEETPPKAEAKDEQTPEPEPVKLPTKEELEGMYKEHREKTLPELEKLFSLSEEDAAALDEAPSKVLPKLAGQLMYDTMMSSYNAVMAAMPSVVNRLISASNEANEAESEFFSAWPDLKGKDNQAAVGTAINAYRSANPRATREQIIANAGVMAMIQLGKDPQAAIAARNKPAESPAASAPAAAPAPPPAAPVAPTGAQPVPPQPAQQDEGNIFSQLSEDFDRDTR